MNAGRPPQRTAPAWPPSSCVPCVELRCPGRKRAALEPGYGLPVKWSAGVGYRYRCTRIARPGNRGTQKNKRGPGRPGTPCPPQAAVCPGTATPWESMSGMRREGASAPHNAPPHPVSAPASPYRNITVWGSVTGMGDPDPLRGGNMIWQGTPNTVTLYPVHHAAQGRPAKLARHPGWTIGECCTCPASTWPGVSHRYVLSRACPAPERESCRRATEATSPDPSVVKAEVHVPSRDSRLPYPTPDDPASSRWVLFP